MYSTYSLGEERDVSPPEGTFLININVVIYYMCHLYSFIPRVRNSFGTIDPIASHRGTTRFSLLLLLYDLLHSLVELVLFRTLGLRRTQPSIRTAEFINYTIGGGTGAAYIHTITVFASGECIV